MKNTHLYSAIFIAGLLGCNGSENPPATDHTTRGPGGEAAARAEQYAPAAFHEAVALREGAMNLEPSERSSVLAKAQARFHEAMTDAEALRAEAREAAKERIDEAGLMIQIVRKIRSHQPRDASGLPGDDDLEEADATLDTARTAYDEGDFVQAGLLATQVTERVSRSRAST